MPPPLPGGPPTELIGLLTLEAFYSVLVVNLSLLSIF